MRELFASLRGRVRAGVSPATAVAAATVVLFACHAASFPSAAFRAEPFAETATDYFLNATRRGFFQNLAVPEFTHFPVLSRLIAGVAVRIGHDYSNYGVFVQVTTIAVAAFSAALLNLPAGTALIPGRVARFFVSLVIGLHPGWGMYLLHNLGYWGVIPGLLLALRVGPRSSAGECAVLGLFSALILPGKAYSLVFLPFLVAGVVRGVLARSPRAALAHGAPCLTLLLLVTSNLGRETPAVAPGVMVHNTYYFFTHLLPHAVAGYFVPGDRRGPVAILSAVLLGVCGFVLVRRRDFGTATRLLACGVIAAGSVALTVKGFYTAPVDLYVAPTFEDDSHFFYPAVVLVIAVASAACVVSRGAPVRGAAIALLAVGSATGGRLSRSDPYASPYTSAGDWKGYTSRMSAERFCVPVNPRGWVVTSSCERLPVSASTRWLDGRERGVFTTPGGRVDLVTIDVIPGQEPAALLVVEPGAPMRQIARVTADHLAVAGFVLTPAMKGGGWVAVVDDESQPMTVSESQVHLFGRPSRQRT